MEGEAVSDYSRFRVEQEGFIRWLILNRPDKRNAMDEDFFPRADPSLFEFRSGP